MEEHIYKDRFGISYYKDKEKTILHRENGPAIEMQSGYREWCLDGQTHRSDGPAIYNEKIFHDPRFGYKEYWTHGKRTMIVSPYGSLVSAHTKEFPEEFIKNSRNLLETH